MPSYQWYQGTNTGVVGRLSIISSDYSSVLQYVACNCCHMSLQDERAKYASPEGLSVHYALPSMNPEVRGHMTVM